MINFYNEADNALYKLPNSQFITQDRFRGTVAPNPEEIEPAGLTATDVYDNYSKKNNYNGYNYGGSNYSLPGDFQQVVDARQKRLNDIDTSTFMGKAKDFFNPQSAENIMTSGYQEPRFQPGIIGAMMGKLDNFRNLPQADQAFISQNMGYTGPTVFGENNSGLGKDPYGINVRSAKGNYADYVDKTAYGLKNDLEKAKGRYDTEEEWFDKTKLMREKLNFYRGKKKESEELRMQEEIAKEERRSDIQNLNERMQKEGVTGADYNQAANIAGGGGGNTATFRGQTARQATYDRDPTTGTAQGYSQHYKKGGRVGYFFGGLAARGMKR